MRKIKKTKIEKYTNNKRETWVRVKFAGTAGTELIMLEREFERKYGKVD